MYACMTANNIHVVTFRGNDDYYIIIIVGTPVFLMQQLTGAFHVMRWYTLLITYIIMPLIFSCLRPVIDQYALWACILLSW